MKIAIIGPTCCGKSTLAKDLSQQLSDAVVHEEPVMVFKQSGTVVALAEKSVKNEKEALFNYSIERLSKMDDDANNIVLGTPLEEFMYMVYPHRYANSNEFTSEFLQTLAPRVQQAMNEFDKIYLVTNYYHIPYIDDGHRPAKSKDFRDAINDILLELLSDHSPWQVLSSNAKNCIMSVSGDRDERVSTIVTDLSHRYSLAR